jgi:hypothetical protein
MPPTVFLSQQVSLPSKNRVKFWEKSEIVFKGDFMFREIISIIGGVRILSDALILYALYRYRYVSFLERREKKPFSFLKFTSIDIFLAFMY